MSTRSKIVAYCRRQLGCSYSYTPSGGKEGSSYNCSYLSTCAYKAAGLSIPRWQGHQNGDGSQSDWVYRNGHWVTDPSKLKPGDLVFFGSKRTNTNHVGVVSKAGSTPYIIDSTPSRGVAERKLPVSAGFVGGGWPMKSLPKEDATTTTTVPTVPTAKYDGDSTVFTVRTDSVAVRTAPSVKGGREVARYKRGDSIVFDRIVAANGYVWGSYVGASSGERRYVAIGKTSLCEV